MSASIFAKLTKLKSVSFKNNPIVKQQADYVKGLFSKKSNPFLSTLVIHWDWWLVFKLIFNKEMILKVFLKTIYFGV